MTMQLRHTVRQAQRGNQETAQELLTQFEPLISRQIAKYRHQYQSEAEARSTAHSTVIECIYSFDLSRRASVPQEMQACIHNAFVREAYHQKRYKKILSKKTAGQTCRQITKTRQATASIYPSSVGKSSATWTPAIRISYGVIPPCQLAIKEINCVGVY